MRVWVIAILINLSTIAMAHLSCLCGEVFRGSYRARSLVAHFNNGKCVHGKQEGTVISEELKDGGILQCEVCFHITSSQATLDKHVTSCERDPRVEEVEDNQDRDGDRDSETAREATATTRAETGRRQLRSSTRVRPPTPAEVEAERERSRQQAQEELHHGAEHRRWVENGDRERVLGDLEGFYFQRRKPVRQTKGKTIELIAAVGGRLLGRILEAQENQCESQEMLTVAFLLVPCLLQRGNHGQQVEWLRGLERLDNSEIGIHTIRVLDQTKNLRDLTVVKSGQARLNKNIASKTGSTTTRERMRRRTERQRRAVTDPTRRGTSAALSATPGEDEGGLSGDAVRRIRDHVYANNPSRGIQLLSAQVMEKSRVLQGGEITDEILEQLRALHPDEDYEPDWDHAVVDSTDYGQEFNDVEVENSLRGMKRGAAGAFSTWSLELLRIVAEDPMFGFADLLAKLYQEMYQGRLRNQVYWQATRLLPILEIAKGKIRPIGIRDVFVKQFSNILMRREMKTTVTHFAPIQAGIGVPDGVQLTVHMLQDVARTILENPVQVGGGELTERGRTGGPPPHGSLRRYGEGDDVDDGDASDVDESSPGSAHPGDASSMSHASQSNTEALAQGGVVEDEDRPKLAGEEGKDDEEDEEEVLRRFGSCKVMLAADAANAFNTQLRKIIENEVREVIPRAIKAFMWVYGGKTPLRDADGKIMLYSSRGVLQGDPMAGMYWALAPTSILKTLARRYPGSDGYAIHDDTTLAGEVRNIVPMFDELKEKWAAIGVDMQPSKCAVLRGEEHRAMDTIWQSRGFLPDRCRGDGIIALGTPIGAEEFRTQEAQAIVKRSELGLAAIQKNFQLALGMVLVRGCINLRPMHLMRTMHPDLMRVATTGFDRAVDSTIAGLLNFPELSHDAKRVRGLKTKDGGLGVMRTHATTHDAFFACYRNVTTQMSRGQLERWAADGVRYEGVRELAEYINVPKDLVVMLKGGGEDERIRDLQSQLSTERSKNLLHTLLQDREISEPKRAWLRSSAHATGRFLDVGNLDPNLRMDPMDQREFTRMRLLMADYIDECEVMCMACNAIGRRTGEFHHMICPRNNGFTVDMHNRITSALGDLITTLHPHAEISYEVPYTIRNPLRLPRRVVADIRARVEGRTFVIDVSGVCVAAKTYVERGSAHTDFAAARIIEAEKEAHYEGIPGVTVVPFIIETTGALAKQARDFLEKMCGIEGADAYAKKENKKRRKLFEQQVMTLIVKVAGDKARGSRPWMVSSRREGDPAVAVLHNNTNHTRRETTQVPIDPLADSVPNQEGEDRQQGREGDRVTGDIQPRADSDWKEGVGEEWDEYPNGDLGDAWEDSPRYQISGAILEEVKGSYSSHSSTDSILPGDLFMELDLKALRTNFKPSEEPGVSSRLRFQAIFDSVPRPPWRPDRPTAEQAAEDFLTEDFMGSLVVLGIQNGMRDLAIREDLG